MTLFSAEEGLHYHDDHAHGEYSLIVVTVGAKLFRHRGQRVVVRKGQIAVANPGELHGCEPHDGTPWAHKTWYVSPTLARTLNVDAQPDTHLQSPVIRAGDAARQLNFAHDQAGSNTNLLEVETIALEALASVFANFGNVTPGSPASQGPKALSKIRKTVYEDAMSANLNLPIALGDLAALADVSRNQVIRDFRKYFGTTPAAYLRHIKLERSCELLRAGRQSADIAAEVGFADQSHFIRRFRKAYGITPTQYRLASGTRHRSHRT